MRAVLPHGPPLGKQPHHITAGPRRPPVFTGVEAECGRLLPSAHAPDEYFLIDSANPKVAGLDGAVRSFVDLLYTLV